MIPIDLAHKKPTDIDIPGWTPWTTEEWNNWLEKSQRLVAEMAALHDAGKISERNALIDANSGHWGALKEWLLALSAGKCWFSEVRELYSHYDVEHFRPKKEARTLNATTRDGYWWLAFDYMNFRVCGNVGNRKKGGWFPLKTGSHISSFESQCEESEARYLLDPIDAHDVTLIDFDPEGKLVPAHEASEWDKERVRETVKRLKLNDHVPLAEARRSIWQSVNFLISDFQRAKSRSSSGNNPVAREMMLEAALKIRAMASKSSELSSVVKACVLWNLDRHLIKLVFG